MRKNERLVEANSELEKSLRIVNKLHREASTKKEKVSSELQEKNKIIDAQTHFIKAVRDAFFVRNRTHRKSKKIKQMADGFKTVKRLWVKTQKYSKNRNQYRLHYDSLKDEWKKLLQTNKHLSFEAEQNNQLVKKE